jgi:NADH dehydrogenase (ubiquinone) 1 alpha subcomplex subunit 9
VFGCTGFLGRYLVSKLAKAGTQVVVPFRDEDEVRHLKPMGDLGVIVPLGWDIRDPERIAECVRHSDVVYNLVGREYETKNFTYDDVHVAGAQRIAEVCYANSVSRLIHVSHLNADKASPSKFYRSKAAGEEVVKAAFPNATIVRPGPCFGPEDKLLNSMAFYPLLWTLNHAATRIRPVHSLDVAQALSNLLTGPDAHKSMTLNLPGPAVHSYASLLNLIASVTYNGTGFAPTIPKPVIMAVSKAAQLAWWPLLSPDEVERRYINDVGTDAKGEKWMGDWEKVGVVPEEVENLAITFLRRYRTAANYTRPVTIPASRGSAAYHELDNYA